MVSYNFNVDFSPLDNTRPFKEGSARCSVALEIQWSPGTWWWLTRPQELYLDEPAERLYNIRV